MARGRSGSSHVPTVAHADSLHAGRGLSAGAVGAATGDGPYPFRQVPGSYASRRVPLGAWFAGGHAASAVARAPSVSFRRPVDLRLCSCRFWASLFGRARALSLFGCSRWGPPKRAIAPVRPRLWPCTRLVVVCLAALGGARVPFGAPRRPSVPLGPRGGLLVFLAPGATPHPVPSVGSPPQPSHPLPPPPRPLGTSCRRSSPTSSRRSRTAVRPALSASALQTSGKCFSSRWTPPFGTRAGPQGTRGDPRGTRVAHRVLGVIHGVLG